MKDEKYSNVFDTILDMVYQAILDSKKSKKSKNNDKSTALFITLNLRENFKIYPNKNLKLKKLDKGVIK